jgi:methionyl-tRNA formyltransferase
MVSAPLRVVFFGTPQFAVPTLEAILASRHPVVGVVTQPDRPRGRGHKTVDAPVKARAHAAGLAVLQPASMRDPAFVEALRQLGADIGVVAAYGKILTEAVLATPRLGMINVHASLLPRYRGAAPVHRAVIAGDSHTGVTIMRVVKALDAGPMLAVARRPIGDNETSEDVERGLAALGAGLLVATLDRLADGPVDEDPQDDREATYANRITREDGTVDWTVSAQALHNQIRGLHPWPRVSAFLNGHRVIFWHSRWHEGTTHALPGVVVVADGDTLRVATGAGLLDLTTVQVEGRRPMPAREFLAGHRVAPGQRFTAAP